MRKLSENEISAFEKLRHKFHAGISPYSMSLIDFIFRTSSRPRKIISLPVIVHFIESGLVVV